MTICLATVVLVAVGTVAFSFGADRTTTGDDDGQAAPASAGSDQVPILFGPLSETRAFPASILRQVERSFAPGPSLSGGPVVVTDLAVEVGEVPIVGSALVEVNFRPVFLLEGDLPAIRDLRPGDTGDDVTQLQSALQATGLTVEDPPGTFGPSTRSAVEDLYQGAGYTAPIVSGGDLDAAALERDAATDMVTDASTALEGARHTYQVALDALNDSVTVARENRDTIVREAQADVDAAAQQVAEIEARLLAGGSDTATDEAELIVAHTELNAAETRQQEEIAAADEAVRSAEEAAETPSDLPEALAVSEADDQLSTAQTSLRDAEAAALTFEQTSGAYLPRGEVLFVPRGDPVVTAAGYAIGDEVTSDDPVVVTVGGGPTVVEVPLNRVDDLVEGMEVTVEVPGVDPVAGLVDRIEERADGAEPNQPSRSVAVLELGSADLLPIGDGTATVQAITTSSVGSVLHVPIDAVAADGSGDPALWIVRSDDTVELVPITVGMVANGYVEVKSSQGDIAEGDMVTTRRTGAKRD